MTSEKPFESQETFSRRAADYDAESSWVTDGRLIEPLFTEFSAGATVLDVCSGTGVVAEHATHLGFEVTAVDLSEQMLERNFPRRRIVASGSRLPLRDHSVDYVVCRQALHYLDIALAFEEFARVARGGFAIGSITMLQSHDYDFWNSYFAVASPGRLHIFSPGEIARSAQELELVVLQQSVLMDRGSLLGPIKHLPSGERARLRAEFLVPPFADRYEVREEGEDLSYVQRWEFVIVGSETVSR